MFDQLKEEGGHEKLYKWAVRGKGFPVLVGKWVSCLEWINQ
jgi:hypothetical protein